MSSTLDFGVQSYCFREIRDNRKVAECVRALGLDRIELCEVHADFDDLDSCRDVVAIYRDAGVSIVSIGVQTFRGDDRERRWLEWAAAAGAHHVSAHVTVDSFARSIPKIREWSREMGVRIGLHCHGGYQFGGSPDVLEHLIKLGGPGIGLCLDTAWAMQIGPRAGNPVDWVKRFAGRIYGVHLKDFTFASNGQWTDTVIGEGNLDLHALIEALRAAKFDGMAVLEYEGDPADPLPALKRCVSAMRSHERP